MPPITSEATPSRTGRSRSWLEEDANESRDQAEYGGRVLEQHREERCILAQLHRFEIAALHPSLFCSSRKAIDQVVASNTMAKPKTM